MLTLARALSMPSNAGQPLPQIWPQFVQQGVELRQGQLAVLASGPGGGKSLMAMNVAVFSKVPALYFSADTDHYTTSLRVASLLSGDRLPQVEHGMANGQRQHYSNLLNRVDNVRWVFEPAPTIEDIAEHVDVFAHVFGEYPQLIVIDNLGNIYSSEDDNTALKHSVESLNVIAKESGACVLILHHLVGEYESGDRPPPLSALIGKVGKVPSLVLTMFRGDFGDIGVCVVKNRFGPADPRGNSRVYLHADMEKAKVG